MTDQPYTCRSCKQSDLLQVLSLGKTPLANSLLTQQQTQEPESTFRLNVVFCENCSLVQIDETVPPETLFRDYLYFSSFSQPIVDHAKQIAERLIPERGLDDNSLVMEIASNDGYLLQYYHRAGIPVLGIEPALNIAKVAEDERGIRTITEFFGADLARKLSARGEQADVIHANNVLAHVADLNGVAEGIKLALKPDGVAVIEMPYVKDLIDHCEFDTIYHEHLCYFSLTALDNLFRGHGMAISDVERTSVHGGSLRIFVSHAESAPPSQNVLGLLEEESQWGADRYEFYKDFAVRVERLRGSLTDILLGLKGLGKRIGAYGAAAKGSTLLNYIGVGADVLDFVVDGSTHKQGLYMPGVHMPILPESKVLEMMPDYVVILAWNYADHIMSKEQEFRDRGGRFIIPVPEVQIV